MDISTKKYTIFKSVRFRTPLAAERKLGLWIDRLGEQEWDHPPTDRLRVIGLHTLAYIMEGDGVLITRHLGRHEVSPGDIMMIFADEPYQYYPLRRMTTRWVAFGGREADLLRTLGYFNYNRPVLHDKGNLFNRAYGEISAIIGREDILSILDRKKILLDLIGRLFKMQRSRDQSRENLRMEQAVRYLGDNFMKDPSIGQAARRAGLSETHFRRLFKEYTGESPKSYILTQKISMAKRYLSEGRSIKETAYALDFSDLFYFMRLFKKITGLPPGSYRA